jgi:TetR/AcrR family transcriptional regulator, lmrAB and yxaGH operons repressor
MAHRDTRLRILDATRALIRRQGYSATGLKEIAARADAPWSSLYHFFPGGKEELIEQALRSAGASYHPLIDAVFDSAPDAPAGCRAWFELSARALERSNYGDGCPVATAALEAASTAERLRAAAWEVFDSWIRAAAQKFAADGWEADPSESDESLDPAARRGWGIR